MTKMLRAVFFILFLLGSASWSLSHADVKIPVEYRITNERPGYCMWAAIETECRFQQIRAGYDMLQLRKLDPDIVKPDGDIIYRNYGTDETVREKLDSLKIRFEMVQTWSNLRTTREFIAKTIKSGRGCIIAVRHGYPTTDKCHAILVVDWNEEKNYYTYIDSNDPIGRYQGTIDYFNQQSTGFALALLK